jgi:hypothetical protein
MFKNRSVEVKLLKKPKSDEEEPKPAEDHYEKASELVYDIAMCTAGLIGFYMAADTVRQCIIVTVAAKTV